MINYSVQHVLILRLLIQFSIKTERSLHNMLFLASSQNLIKHELGFYDFVRTKTGVYSKTVNSILSEFINYEIMLPKTHKVSEKGLNVYYALAGVLKYFNDYPDRCVKIWYQAKGCPVQLEFLVRRNIIYHRAKAGYRIFSGEEYEKIFE